MAGCCRCIKCHAIAADRHKGCRKRQRFPEDLIAWQCEGHFTCDLQWMPALSRRAMSLCMVRAS